MSGQSVMDRVQAARHSITGSSLAKSVCKASTEEIMGPKKKHLDYLLHCTNASNVNIPELGDLLVERTVHTNWVVVFKALVSCHNLMIYGNERFTQYMASRSGCFNLANFLDKGNIQGYDMSTFIRRYAKYLNEKAYAYRTVAFDFCRVKRGKEDGMLRTMGIEKLLKTLPILQQQLDALLDFECSTNELINGVITSCFMLLFRDCIRLFACYNDGIINLLEKYFDMSKKSCKEALDLYKKFLIRMERVSEFLKVAEQVGIDKGEIPDLAKAPSSLLEALEQHLASLEGKKTTSKTTSSSLNTQVSAFKAASANALGHIDFNDVQQSLELEEKRLTELKEEHMKASEGQGDSAPSPESQPQPNPFAPAAPAVNTAAVNTAAGTGNITVSVQQPPPTADTGNAGGKSSDDLLNLDSNPFAETVYAVVAASRLQQPQPTSAPVTAAGGMAWGSTNGYYRRPSAGAPYGVAAAPPSPVSPIDSAPGFGNNTVEADFAKAFGSPAASSSQGEDLLGDVLKPISTNKEAPPQKNNENLLADSSGNLDVTINQLAGNLNITSGMSPRKVEHNWSKSQTGGTKTGGANWSPQPAISTTTATWAQPQPWAAPAAPPPMAMMGGGGAHPMNQPYPPAGQFQQQPGMAVPPTQQPQSTNPFGL